MLALTGGCSKSMWLLGLLINNCHAHCSCHVISFTRPSDSSGGSRNLRRGFPSMLGRTVKCARIARTKIFYTGHAHFCIDVAALTMRIESRVCPACFKLTTEQGKFWCSNSGGELYNYSALFIFIRASLTTPEIVEWCAVWSFSWPKACPWKEELVQYNALPERQYIMIRERIWTAELHLLHAWCDKASQNIIFDDTNS